MQILGGVVGVGVLVVLVVPIAIGIVVVVVPIAIGMVVTIAIGIVEVTL